jgi:hypothetical protein
MHRNIQPRITIAHHARDEIGGDGQPIQIDRPILQRTVERQRKHAMSASAHGSCAQQSSRARGQGGVGFRRGVSISNL